MFPALTFLPAFHMISTMKIMFQGGLKGRVPVSPEKGFLIHNSERCYILPWPPASDIYDCPEEGKLLVFVPFNKTDLDLVT